MQLGIFTHYLPGTIEDTARRARAFGFDCVSSIWNSAIGAFSPG
jgi:hypothetical protein